MATLQKIQAEKKRRKIEERLRYFEPTKPPHNDQSGFYLSQADIRIGLGGNRSGKTEIGAYDSLQFCLGKHVVRSAHKMPPVHGRVVAPKYEDGCKGVILKKYREMIPHSELRGSSWVKAWSEKSKLLSFANGSTVNFKSAEMDLNTFGGADLDFAWEDEHIPHKYFIENRARLVDRNGYHIKTMTPEAGQTWEEDFILNPPKGLDVEHWFFSTENNPYLSKKGVAQLKASIQDPRLYKAKLLGQFVALAGLVYDEFNPANVICRDFDIPNHWYKLCVIDPHLRKFTAILWVAFSPDGEIVVYRAHKIKQNVEQIAKFIRAQSAGERIDMFIGDEAMGGKGENIFGEESVLAQLNAYGIPVIPTNQSSDKAFESGVNKVREAIHPDVNGMVALKVFESLNTPVEHIDGKLTGSIFWEFKRYRFKKEQKSDEETFREKVATVDDDYLDCLRYAIMSGRVDTEPVVVVSNETEVDPFTGW